MKKLLSCLGILVLTSSLSYADRSNDEIGINAGTLSIYNEDGVELQNLSVGGTYQVSVDNSPLKPRVDLEHVTIDDYDGVKSLTKGSVNAIYEYETGTSVTPYALAGAGYEYVDGNKEDTFGSHPFVQGGVGVSYKLDNGLKLKVEGKALQIIDGNNEENEIFVTSGVSVPLSFFGDTNQCPVKINGADADRDGVLDEVDQCPNTPCYFTVDAYGCPIKATLRLYFDVDKAIIKQEYDYKVQTFAQYLLANKGTTVVISGHTDSDASDAYNLELSQRRADAVLQRIVELGVSEARLSAIGMGERQPVASNSTEYGKAKNRRIEVKITYPTNKAGN